MAEDAPGLDEISTRWPLVRDPLRFVMRYAPAIRAYLERLLPDPHDAEDAAQDFLLKGILRGFVRAEPLRGRFRDYLKAAVRNAALTSLQRRTTAAPGDAGLAGLADPRSEARADEGWMAEWRRCVLDRALQALEHHQQRAPGNLFYTAVRLTLDYPEEDSVALAARAAALTGRPVGAAAFRKQLSRARRLFAELIRDEVRQTLQQPTPERVEEELADLGLLASLRAFLSP
jgi:hypothetical protein